MVQRRIVFGNFIETHVDENHSKFRCTGRNGEEFYLLLVKIFNGADVDLVGSSSSRSMFPSNIQFRKDTNATKEVIGLNK